MNVLDKIKGISEKDPYALAVLTEESSLHFHHLQRLVDAGVYALQKEGLSPGDRTCLCFASPLLHFVISLSALKLRLLQFSLQITPQSHVINTEVLDADMDFVVSDRELKLKLPVINIDSIASLESNLMNRLDESALAVDENAVAILVRGSGTTGAPKKIAITFKNFEDLIERDVHLREIKPNERHFSLTPFEFYTAKRRLFATISVGACAILREKPSITFDDVYGKFAVDHLSIAVPHAVQMLSAYSMLKIPRYPRLKTLFIGGSPVSEPLRLSIREKICPNLFIAYGSNEFGEACIASPVEQGLDQDCVGLPCEGVELEVVDEQDQVCPQGTVGAVRLRGKGAINAYEKNPTETEKFFRNGWHYPGDLGEMSSNGSLLFKGRKDDLIVFDGVNIYPRELEIILEKLSSVIDVAAFSLLINENQVPVLAFSASNIIETKTLEDLYQKQMGWKSPKMFMQLEALPRNKAGKISKLALRKMFIKHLKAQNEASANID